MSFVLQTVAGILRDNGSIMHHSVDSNDIIAGNYGCHNHPSQCCHKANLFTAFSTSVECVNDDSKDCHRSIWPINQPWVSLCDAFLHFLYKCCSSIFYMCTTRTTENYLWLSSIQRNRMCRRCEYVIWIPIPTVRKMFNL